MPGAARLKIALLLRARRRSSPANPVKVHPVIVGLYVVLFAACGAGGGAMLIEARAEHQKLRQAEIAGERLLAEARAQLAQQKKILDRLRTDPAYVEKILRQRTYTRPGDMIFRFEN